MTHIAPASVRIVLVEPAGPLNVGSVARVMKNFGLSHLFLVNPQCDPQAEQARMMAVHAKDVLEKAICVESIPEALVGVQRAIATTGEQHDFPTPLESPRQVLPWLLASSDSPTTVNRSSSEPSSEPSENHLTTGALIFGREESGLTTHELHYAQRLLHIPTYDTYRSLNLAQAVAVCCYELAQLQHHPSPPSASSAQLQAQFQMAGPPLTEPPAPQEMIEGLHQHLQSVLLEIGYLYPHTAESRMKRFRRLSHRAQPSGHEIQMLRGILSQVEWAIKHLGNVKEDG